MAKFSARELERIRKYCTAVRVLAPTKSLSPVLFTDRCVIDDALDSFH